ncbi:MAG: hypothetical protein K5886_04320 [Lachnospiraceae bacterium]|nr:hypothetical protein [Lachnospiraceae bacterium]
MGYDYLKKKVSDYTDKKKNTDEEDLILSGDEARLSELMQHAGMLDPDVAEKLSRIAGDQAAERDRIEGEKEVLKEEKTELSGRISGELGKIGEAKGKLDGISDNKYAVGADSAIRKCEEFIGQLKDLAGQLGSDVSDEGFGALSGGTGGSPDLTGYPDDTVLSLNDNSSEQTAPLSSPTFIIPGQNTGGSLFGGGEFVPLLSTGQEIRTMILDGRSVDVFDHPFEPNDYRICDQGSAYPRDADGNSTGPTGTCGCCASGTVINKAGGHTSEKEVVDYALSHGLCASSGGTAPDGWVGILSGAGISASDNSGTSLEELAKKVEEGHGVIIGVSARTYCREMYGRYFPGAADGHAMVLESVVRDHETGEIIEYVVSDSNGYDTYDACHRVPAKVLEKAYKRKRKAAVVTDDVIW